MCKATIGFDLGMKCGWSIRHPGRHIDCGVYNLKGGRFEGGGMRFVRFRKFVEGMLDLRSGIGIVGYEEVRRHLGTDAAHVYGGLQAILTEICEARDLPYLGIPVGTIKKHATGKGNANKEAMLSAARNRWPDLSIEDDNVADALFVSELAEMELVTDGKLDQV